MFIFKIQLANSCRKFILSWDNILSIILRDNTIHFWTLASLFFSSVMIMSIIIHIETETGSYINMGIDQLIMQIANIMK